MSKDIHDKKGKNLSRIDSFWARCYCSLAPADVGPYYISSFKDENKQEKNALGSRLQFKSLDQLWVGECEPVMLFPTATAAAKVPLSKALGHTGQLSRVKVITLSKAMLTLKKKSTRSLQSAVLAR